jgi:hypothetical protein
MLTMSRARTLRFSIGLVLGLLFGCGESRSIAQTNDVETLQRALAAKLRLTRITADRTEIVTPAAAGELLVDGLLMYSVEASGAALNTYKDGRISQTAGDAIKNSWFSTDPNGHGKYPQRKFVAGERCWITGIEVHKDSILLVLYSSAYSGIRFHGRLKVPFADGRTLPDMSSAWRLIDNVLKIDAATEIDPPREVQSAQVIDNVPSVPAVVSSHPKGGAQDISWGMSKDRVLAVFGEPTRQTKDRDKETLFFDAASVKVTFTGGVVSDIEAIE